MSKSGAQRVAIVGASSQIGHTLIQRLEAAGYVAYRIGREDRGSANGITTHIFYELSESFVPSLDYADAVISLAPLPSIEVVVKMAQALRAKRIIAFGSTGRFSKVGSTSLIERDFVVQQEHAEMLFTKHCEELDIGWTLFRPTMIYGADNDQNIFFIKTMIRKFGFFPIPMGANGLRQPVHINDLAEACLSVLVREASFNKAYNLGGNDILALSELVKKIFQSEGRTPLILPIPSSLYFGIIEIAKKIPKYSFLRKEMVERMFKDLTVNNQEAIDDFGYSPIPFCLKNQPTDRKN